MASSREPSAADLPPAVVNTAALAFYARNFSRVVAALIVCLALLGLMFGWHVFTERRTVDREYFAVDFQTGQMIRLSPVSEPYLGDQALLSRVKDCLERVNTYDFVNYQRQFTESSECFTDDGWRAFVKALEDTSTFKTVKENRLVTQAVAGGVPVITEKGVVGGVMTWKVQMPLRLAFQGGFGGRAVAPQNLLVTTTIKRVPVFKNKFGVGINSYIAEEVRR